MEEKTVDFKSYERKKKFEDRKEQAKDKIKRGVNSVINGYNNNKEFWNIAIPVLIAGVGTTAKVVTKNKRIKTEQNLKDLYCYDRSLGAYWHLKRKLTQREMLEIQRRRKTGEAMGSILADMKVLKR